MPRTSNSSFDKKSNYGTAHGKIDFMGPRARKMKHVLLIAVSVRVVMATQDTCFLPRGYTNHLVGLVFCSHPRYQNLVTQRNAGICLGVRVGVLDFRFQNCVHCESGHSERQVAQRVRVGHRATYDDMNPRLGLIQQCTWFCFLASMRTIKRTYRRRETRQRFVQV